MKQGLFPFISITNFFLLFVKI